MDKFFANAFEFSPIGVGLVSIEGNWIQVNPALRQIMGYSNEEFAHFKFRDICHPDDTPFMRNAFLSFMNRELKSYEMEKRLIHKNGDIVWVQLNVSLVHEDSGSPLYFIAQFQDITEKKKLRAKLQSSEAMYQLISENSTDLVGVLNPDLVVLYASPSHEKVLGYSDCIGMHASRFYHTDDTLHVKQEIEMMVKERAMRRFELRLTPVNGSILYAEVQASPIFSINGELELIVYSTRDITEKKRADEILIQNEKLYRSLYEGLHSISRESQTVLKKRDLLDALARIVGKIFGTDEVGVITAYQDGEVQFGKQNWKVNIPYEVLLKTDKILLIHDHSIYIKVASPNHDDKFFIAVKKQQDTSVPVALIQGLMTISRFSDIIAINIDQIEDILSELNLLIKQRQGPAWLSRLLFKVAEQQRLKLSIDLHDSALQEQIIWYRKLAEFIDEAPLPEEKLLELKRIQNGFEDVIHQIRITCNELTPPFLKKLGIIQALESLIQETRIRNGEFLITFHHNGHFEELNHEQVLGLFRIIQELLANAAKHSKATDVQITLNSEQDRITLSYKDDGIGVEEKVFYGTTKQIGLYGIQERVRSLEGTITFNSSDTGLNIDISLPVHVDWNEDATIS